MSTKERIKNFIYLTLAVLSLLYYAVCVLWAWAGVSWLWIWLVLAAFCITRHVMLVRKIGMPGKTGKVCRILLVLAVLFFAFVESRIVGAMTQDVPEGLDYVITLGAAVRGDVPTRPMQQRMDRTLAYLEDNPGTTAIVSGGKGPNENISEAECIASYLVENGIDKDRIITEDRSTDTEENIRNSFAFIPEGSSVGVITNSFHIYRAIKVADAQGHEVAGVPAVTLLPLGIHYTVREFFAVVELMLKHGFAAAV